MGRGRGELGLLALTLTLAGGSLESGGWFSRSQELLSCARERWGAQQHLPVPAGFLLACLTFNLEIKAQLSVTLRHKRDQKSSSWRCSFLGLQAAVSEKIENRKLLFQKQCFLNGYSCCKIWKICRDIRIGLCKFN